MAKQNILNTDYNKQLYIMLEDLKDTITRFKTSLNKDINFQPYADTINENFSSLMSDHDNNVNNLRIDLQQTLDSIKDMIDQTQGLIMTNLQQIPIETYNLLIDKIQQISTALENLTIDFDYNQINENIYDTLTPCFEELKSLIQSNDNPQGGSLDIDSEYLKKLIDDLDYIVQAKKYYAPVDDTIAPIEPDPLQLRNNTALMPSRIYVGYNSTLNNYILPRILFKTVPGYQYLIYISFKNYTTSKKNKKFKLYFNDEFVMEVNTLVTTTNYVFPSLYKIFISEQEYNYIHVVLESEEITTNYMSNFTVELAGFNGEFITKYYDYTIEKYMNNYVIFRVGEAKYYTYTTPVEAPILLPTSPTQTYTALTQTPMMAMYHKTNYTTTLPTGQYCIGINHAGKVALYYKGSQTFVVEDVVPLSVAVAGIQFSFTTNIIFGIIDTDYVFHYFTLGNNDLKPVDYGDQFPGTDVIKMNSTRDLVGEPGYTFLNIFGLTYKDGTNRIIYKGGVVDNTFRHFEYRKGTQWKMGVVAKLIVDNKPRKNIIRSYIYSNGEWYRDEYIFDSTVLSDIKYKKLNSYIIEGDFDAIHPGAGNAYFGEKDGNLTLYEHPAIDYTEILNSEI